MGEERNSTRDENKGKGTDCPGEALVLGDVCDVERLHGVFNVLSIHVVNLTDITVPEEKHRNTNNFTTNPAQ